MFPVTIAQREKPKETKQNQKTNGYYVKGKQRHNTRTIHEYRGMCKASIGPCAIKQEAI
jgi:hypothetical protein